MDINQKLAEFCGAFTGDGWMETRGKTVCIATSNKERDYRRELLKLSNSVWEKEAKEGEYPSWRAGAVIIYSKKVVHSLENIGFKRGPKANTVRVPKKILHGNERIQKSFLRGYFDTDGCVHFRKNKKGIKDRAVIEFVSTSKGLLKDIKRMCKNLNFEARGRKPYKNKKKWKTGYSLCMYRKKDIERWFSEIKPRNKKHINRFYNWKKSILKA